MLFNSLEFVLFAAVVFPIYFVLRSWRARTAWLLVASWAFYAAWSPRFLLLLIGTTWVDFAFARRIDRAMDEGDDGRARARRLVAASVTMNLGVLAFFKYGGFFYQQAAALVALPPPPLFLLAAPPLGVSFYTFHSISYIIDTYRRLRPPTRVFREFALYVAFFPQLIAGPISRWTFVGPQIQSPRSVGDGDVEQALFRIIRGLVKKVVLADTLARMVDQVYVDVGSAAPAEIAVALYAFAFQIYFDFSGYTDIALGLARLLGFRLPENFDHPYRATSPREFWQRWHITLSTWLRDYLYIPLGGNRRGRVRTDANLLMTMLLGGLWHGAAWTFVLWGAFHGVWLIAHRALARDGRQPLTPRWLRRIVTFHLVLAGWVLFRAPSLGAVADVVQALLSRRPMTGPFPVAACLVIAIGILSHALADRIDLERGWRGAPRLLQGACVGAVILLVGVFSESTRQFIYFQF